MVSKITTIDKYPLEKRRLVKKAIAKSIKWYILIGFILLLNLYSEAGAAPLQQYLILAAIIFILELVYQNMLYKRYFYNIERKFLIIREGVASRRERNIPHKRIHDIYVDQDILDRIFNLWDLHLTTTDSRLFNIHIDGLSGKNAKAIRNILLKKI